MQDLLNEITSALRAVFLGGDHVSLVIALAAVLIAAFAMRRSTQIGAMTLFALLLFAGGTFFAGLVTGAPKGATLSQWGARFVAELNGGLDRILDMRAGALIALFAAFMIVLFLAFLIRSRVSVNIAPGGGGGHGGGHH